jgi:hypothetical protein
MLEFRPHVVFLLKDHISNLVYWQIFRIFEDSLVDIQGLEGSLYPIGLTFFEKSSYSLKMVLFYHNFSIVGNFENFLKNISKFRNFKIHKI